MINTTKAFASAQGTVSNTALSLTDAPFSFTNAELLRANRAYVFVNSNSVRVWWDGVNTPTVSEGVLFSVGFEILSPNIPNLSIIRNGSTDSQVAIILEE